MSRALLVLAALGALACHAPSRAVDVPRPVARAAPSGAVVVGAPIAFANDLTVLAVDEDGGALSRITTYDGSIRATVLLGGRPVALAPLSDGRVLVLDRAAGAVIALRFDPFGEQAREIARASVAPDPVALLVDEGRAVAYVASGASGELTVLDARSLRRLDSVALLREPRALALDRDRGRLFVAHLVGGRLSVVDTDALAVSQLALPTGPRPDSTDAYVEGGGCRSSYVGVRCVPGRRVVPKLRDAATVARAMVLEGDRLFVAHTVVHTGDHGSTPQRYGNGGEPGVPWPLDVVSVLDAERLSWAPALVSPAREYVEARPLAPDPSAVALRDGRLLVASLAGDLLAERDASDTHAIRRRALRGCAGPTGLAVGHDGTTAVLCALSRSVHLVDRPMRLPELVVQLDEELATAADGRRLFHRLDHSRVGLWCALCHPDGRDDGLVWSTPNGPRQTPWLAGRLDGTAPYGWGGEHRTLRESLESTRSRLAGSHHAFDLAALERYLLEGLPVPSVRDPTDGDAFQRAGCPDCHAPRRALAASYYDATDGRAHDLGGGGRFETPSLRFVGRTAPYFHDGRFPTLEAVVDGHAISMGARPDDREALLRYLRSR